MTTPTRFYLDGPAPNLAAIFTALPRGQYHVLANVGLTGCYDDTMGSDAAREVWRKLAARGFRRSMTPRFTESELRVLIRD